VKGVLCEEHGVAQGYREGKGCGKNTGKITRKEHKGGGGVFKGGYFVGGHVRVLLTDR